jgi:hypothetical protein
MNMMLIPTESDWHSEPWCIDTPYAYEHFSGKSIEEASELFVKNSIYYHEDIMFMPLQCFRYYIHAYMNYLLSDKSKGDSSGADCFFGLIKFRKAEILAADENLRAKISEVLRRLGASQEWYDAELEIFGDFTTKSAELLRLINE